MTFYTIALPKGGTGKSTLAAELVLALAARGRTVLAGDNDEQGNFTRRLGIRPTTSVEYTNADVLAGTVEPTPDTAPSPKPGISVLAGATDLRAVAENPPPDLVTSLRDMDLSAWDDQVYDTPPATGLLLLAALAAARTAEKGDDGRPEGVIIAPVECATEAYEQLGRLEALLEKRIAPRINRGATVTFIVPTKYDGRRRLDRDIVDALTKRHPGRVTHPIRETVAVRDSYTGYMAVSEYAPDEPITTDITTVFNQILEGTTP